jgi:hypothetical protein
LNASAKSLPFASIAARSSAVIGAAPDGEVSVGAGALQPAMTTDAIQRRMNCLAMCFLVSVVPN